MKKTSQYAYVAGLLDGEGTITLLYKRPDAQFRTAELQISNTTLEIIEWCREHFNMNVVCVRRKNIMPVYSVGLSCRAAVEFLEKVWPYLRHPEKRYRARLIVEQYKHLVKPGRYHPDLIKPRLAFEKAFFAHPMTKARVERRPFLRPTKHYIEGYQKARGRVPYAKRDDF